MSQSFSNLEGESVSQLASADVAASQNEAMSRQESGNSKKYIKYGAIGVGLAAVAAIAAPQAAEAIDQIAENAHWAVPAVMTTEAMWNIGAITMLGAAGSKVINTEQVKMSYHDARAAYIERHTAPERESEASLAIRSLASLVGAKSAAWEGIKGVSALRNQVEEARARLAEVRHNKAFKTGFVINALGELGTFGIIVGGSIAELPPQTWPLTMSVAVGAMSFPSIPLWTAMAKAHWRDKQESK